MSGPFCTGSEWVIAEDKDAVADSLLVGEWRGMKAKDSVDDRMKMTIERDTNVRAPQYLVTVRGDSLQLHDVLVVTKIGDVLFGDLYPVKDEGERWDVIPVHLIMRAERSGNRITVQYMDPKWLKKYLQSHPGEVSTVELGDWVVFTDSTAKVRRFLRSTLDAKDAYTGESEFVRVH
jgi:hypothetical protein